MIATTLTVSSPPSISASRRSISSPPMIAMALMLPTARNRPRRCEPLMMATIQRTGFGRSGRWGSGSGPTRSPGLRSGQVAGQRRELAARLAVSARPDVLKLDQREPPDGGMVAQHPHRGVTLGVRDPKGFVRFAHPCPSLSRRTAQ